MGIVQRQVAQEMDTPQAAGSVLGHNNPPPAEMARDEFNVKIDAALRKRNLTRARFDELIGQASRAVAIDEETAGRCGELVKSLRAGMKLIDEVHAETKAPYLAAGREIDGLKNALRDPLDQAKRTVEGKQSVFLQEQERQRQIELRRQREAEDARRREEAERLAAEAAARGPGEVAPIPPELEPLPIAAEPEREIIRGDFGAAVSGQKVWKSEVLDYEVAFMAVSDNEKVRAAIDAAIAGMVRAGSRSIEGVRIFQTIKASNR